MKSFVVLLVLPTKASIVTSQSKEKRFFEIPSNSPFTNQFKFDTIVCKALDRGPHRPAISLTTALLLISSPS
jgi:hypothetical protein